MMRTTIAMALLAACVSGCGDKPQTLDAASAKKADGKAWEASNSAYLAEGWKAGDQASWEAQMRTRAQGQNEYSRSAAAPAAAAAAASAPK
jgi:hypothetical protein